MRIDPKQNKFRFPQNKKVIFLLKCSIGQSYPKKTPLNGPMVLKEPAGLRGVSTRSFQRIFQWNIIC